MKRNYFLLAGLLLALAMPVSSCSKKEAGTTGPAATLPGNEPDNADDTPPSPQDPNIVGPYVGAWENNSLTIVLLADGRTIALNRLSGAVPTETGYYRINTDGSIDMEWRFSGHEHHWQQLNGNSYTLGTQDLQRTGSAAQAPAAYNRLYTMLVNESNPFLNRFTVGIAANSASDASDPNPKNVISGATVYNGAGIHFADSFGGQEWYEMPNHQINSYDSYSRADVWLLPNGRFCSEMWLWKGVDAHDYAHVQHYLSWGKYSVTPGTDPVQGDDVKVVYDNGRTATYKAVGGRRYLRTKAIIYHNWALK